MSESTYRSLHLIFVGVPVWGTFIYLAVVLRLYPPHRHVNGKVEYPPHMAPGRVDSLKGPGQ